MVDLMSLLSDALIGSFQMFMLNDFGKNMFPYRIKTCWKRILIYGVTALVILSVNHIESTFINIMMIPVSYTIASIVIFQGSVWKKIILACCYYMLAIVPEFLFAVITGAYGVTGTENNFHSELEKLLSLLLMSTITFLLVKCVNQITRKKNYQTIENKLFTVLLTLPAATIIIFMCIYYSQISYTGVNRIMIPIGAALLLMTNICIFAVFDKLIEKSEEVKKMELLYQKSKAENINQKYINKVNEDKRVFLHDVNKFLCTAASLIENGKNLELDSMVRHLGIRMEELKNYSYCADPVLNSILCERKFVAESKGILYKIKLGNNLRTDFIEDLDLISIVGNLLDNAIEAAEKTKKDQHVICNMYMGNEGHLLVMEFYNSYRIELGEVENVLKKVENIKDAIAVVSKEKNEILAMVEPASITSEMVLEREKFCQELFDTVLSYDEHYFMEFDQEKVQLAVDSRNEAAAYSLLYGLQKMGILLKNKPILMEEILNDSVIPDKYRWLTVPWLKALLKSGLIRKRNDGKFEAIENVEWSQKEQQWNVAFDKWYDKLGNVSTLEYIKLNADEFANIMSGKTDPVSLLYPDGSNKYTQALYVENTATKYINASICKIIKKVQKRVPGQKIKILEVGAGTGATTEWVFKALEGSEFEYCFTDISKYFFPDAVNRFGKNPNVTIKKLDLNEDFVAQGFCPNSYDVIIGAYVLNNVRDI